MNNTPRQPWLALTGLALGVTVTNGFARFAYGLLLPAMKSEMGWNYAQAGWLNTANALGYIAGAILTMVMIRRISASSLFALGLVATTVCLMATGLESALYWQTIWRILAGVFGAMSFATAGTLAAQLFQDDPRRNALAIAILFGSGGGLGILLAGASLPLMLETYGQASWPWGWIVIGTVSFCFLPLGLWSAYQLQTPIQSTSKSSPLPVLKMLYEIIGYITFGLGYIVYLTFLSAWLTEQSASAPFIALVWVTLGLSIFLSPFVWRPVLAKFASGAPLAMILTGIALGSAMPVILHGTCAPLISAVVFGLSVFMAPGAVTNFSRKNLAAESWGQAIGLFTVVFAIAQTIGPYAAGLVGDAFGDIGISLMMASGVLLTGAAISLFQRPLEHP